MTTTEAPAWARGFDLDELRAVARVHQQFDQPYALGAFSRVKENTVAEWLAEGQCLTFGGDPPDTGCQIVSTNVRTPIRDFTGEVRAYLPPGAMSMRHPASSSARGWADLLEVLTGHVPFTEGRQVWLEGWVEAPQVQDLAMRAGLHLMATKIKASSELLGVWAPAPAGTGSVLHAEEHVTLAQLPLRLQVAAAASEVADIAGWADHYSSYNARHSWAALGLTSYTAPGERPSAEQIAKPAEMSKAWKAEHPDWQRWAVAPTPLLERLPATGALLADLRAGLGAAEFQRVRLMRLQPGGGELTRHSDITDPEAGAALGKLVRIHVPLVTNHDVRFRQWTLGGQQLEANMAPGEVWYLDTRKPHKAGNYGATERIHLVVDVYVNPAVRDLLLRSRTAPAAAA